MEDEQQAKRDAVRHEQENKREEEREKKRGSKGRGGERFGDFIDDDDDIFKRRQREVDEKKRRRDERKKDDIWRRREEHKRGMKDRDKEKLMAKIREDAKKVAMSLSKSMEKRGYFLRLYLEGDCLKHISDTKRLLSRSIENIYFKFSSPVIF